MLIHAYEGLYLPGLRTKLVAQHVVREGDDSIGKVWGSDAKGSKTESVRIRGSSKSLSWIGVTLYT